MGKETPGGPPPGGSFQSPHLPATTLTSSSSFSFGFFFSGSSSSITGQMNSCARFNCLRLLAARGRQRQRQRQRQHHELRGGFLFAPPQDAEPDGILGNLCELLLLTKSDIHLFAEICECFFFVFFFLLLVIFFLLITISVIARLIVVVIAGWVRVIAGLIVVIGGR